jgi:hypothetical protein
MPTTTRIMEPPQLPPELFNRVMGFATDANSDVKVMCNFSLVSRRWYMAMSDRIYQRCRTMANITRFLRCGSLSAPS